VKLLELSVEFAKIIIPKEILKKNYKEHLKTSHPNEDKDDLSGFTKNVLQVCYQNYKRKMRMWIRMTFSFHSLIFSIITIHMLKTGKILSENILTFTQDARNCSS